MLVIKFMYTTTVEIFPLRHEPFIEPFFISTYKLKRCSANKW